MRGHPDRYPIGPLHEYPLYVEILAQVDVARTEVKALEEKYGLRPWDDNPTAAVEEYKSKVWWFRQLYGAGNWAARRWEEESLRALAPKIREVLAANGGEMSVTQLLRAYPPVRECGLYAGQVPAMFKAVEGVEVLPAKKGHGWRVRLLEEEESPSS